ncbi:MAG: type 1 glutamine amidotransferase [Spirochaetia bacterium]|nr:type 1 glutamine amidotransferase [Spirochaetia bacterium]
MNFYCLTHVPFEGPENIQNWAWEHHHNFVTAKSYEYEFPDINSFDVLVSMGGPMSANDDSIYPWLVEEKKLIEKAISHNKKFIGICLGAQIAANVLGAQVKPNYEKEIGWFDVELTAEGRSHCKLVNVPDTFSVFHWHGETFDIPHKAIHLMQSAGCTNQGFIYNECVLGLQFHIELTSDGLITMMENSLEDMTSGKYIQTESEIRKMTKPMVQKTMPIFNEIMNSFLIH